MNQIHQEVLRKEGPILNNRITEPCLEMILTHLLANGILNANEIASIKALSTRYEKVNALVMMLPSKGPDAYSAFLNALEEEGSGDVAEKLRVTEERLLNPDDFETDGPTPLEELFEDLGEMKGRVIENSELCRISLNFPPSKLQAVRDVMELSSGQESSPRSEKEIQEVFFKWKEQKGNEATIEAFALLLYNAGAPILDLIECFDLPEETDD